MAGVGIEYSWGKSKLEFRRRINDQIPANLHDNILKSLCPQVLPLSRIRKFARRTRDYRQVYRIFDIRHAATGSESLEDTCTGSHSLIETMRKERKSHRNIVDLESKFILNC
eukprot:Pompholyxophrys_punicea_v1_NODE_18_length_5920_cov_44.741176.p6 type:complete len:112 gc:universal NODE_18_length_5920_cov_44.741176:2643-2978(+)